MEQPRGNLKRRSLLAACGTAIGLGGCLGEPSESPAQGEQASDETRTPTAAQKTPTPTDEETTHTATEEETPTDTEEDTPTQTEDDTPTETEEAGNGDNWESGWYTRPDSQPSNTPSKLQCEEDGTNRYEQRFKENGFEWGNGNNWEIRVNESSVSYGSSVTIRIKNVSDKEQNRGTDGMYNIQVKTEVGWQDVRVWHEENGQPVYPDEARIHEAGEAEDWEFTMTEDGFDSDDACPDLQEGRYRFAYFGFDDHSEPDAIGVGFDLNR